MLTLRQIGNFASSYELIPIAALVVLCTVAERFLIPGLVVILILVMVRWFSTSKLLPRTPLDFCIAGLMVMAVVSLLITALPEKSQVQALRLFICIGLFYSLAAWATTVRRVEALEIGIVLFSVLLAGAALISVQWVVEKIRFLDFAFLNRLPELVSDRVHPNVMAGNLAILVPFPIAAALFSYKRYPVILRFCFLLAALFIIGIIVLTQSRGAVLAAAAAIFLMVWLWSAWAGGALTLAGIAVLGYFYFTGFDFVRGYYWLVSAGGDTLGIRMEIWSRALFMLQDFPFTGIGMGSFTEVMNMLYPLRPTPVEIGHAHQIFLQVGVDLGLPGLVAWAACLLSATACAWDLYIQGRNRQSGWMLCMGVGVLASMAALLVHGMTDAVTWGTRAEVVTWGIWGICAGAWIFSRSPAFMHKNVPESSQ